MEGSPVLEVVESPIDAEDAIRTDAPLPDALPVLPLRETVTFPDTMTPLAVGQERSIKLVNDVLGANRMLVMVASRDPENEEPGPEDLDQVGVVGEHRGDQTAGDGHERAQMRPTQPDREGQLAGLPVEQAEVGVGGDPMDGFRRGPGNLLDLDPALAREHEERLLRAAVERDREVVLLGDF